MYVLNEASIAHTFCDPIFITAYVGSLSKSHETVLHPGLKKYLSTLEDEGLFGKIHNIKSNINNYTTAIQYEAGLIYVPNNLSELDKNFIRVNCDKYLYAEEDILEQLWLMTKEKPNKAVQVNALVEAFGYEKRIVSSPGYGKFQLTNIRIGSQHRELYSFT
ncbi:hypothetical protein [Anabaena sp. PCC 7108]|uniref:hypothetical protein n=1 Tax=Anabaena sp. PCC 7108 TaxID=163908 RepID=UPI00035CC541|nr:hypothetical protein [Anabaena sp. PCC 7108]